jgi:hypothetical protein
MVAYDRKFEVCRHCIGFRASCLSSTNLTRKQAAPPGTKLRPFHCRRTSCSVAGLLKRGADWLLQQEENPLEFDRDSTPGATKKANFTRPGSGRGSPAAPAVRRSPSFSFVKGCRREMYSRDMYSRRTSRSSAHRLQLCCHSAHSVGSGC